VPHKLFRPKYVTMTKLTGYCGRPKSRCAASLRSEDAGSGRGRGTGVCPFCQAGLIHWAGSIVPIR
jgi:hypothetical protein